MRRELIESIAGTLIATAPLAIAEPMEIRSETFSIQTISCQNGLDIEKFETVRCLVVSGGDEICREHFTYDVRVTNPDALGKVARTLDMGHSDDAGLGEYYLSMTADDDHQYGVHGYGKDGDAMFAIRQDGDAIHFDVVESAHGTVGEGYVFYDCRE